FLSSRANYRPVMEYCGGTEIGGAYLSSTVVQPNMPSAFATPAFALGVELMDDQGNVLEGATQGEVALVPPSIGLSLKLLNKDHDKSYYEGMPTYKGEQLRRHGDQMQRFENGYLCSHGRADDTMNLGGIKTSSAEIERAVNLLEDVYESAAIAIEPKGGGPSLLAVYVVAHNKSIDKEALHKDIQKQIRAHLNPLFKVSDVVLIDKLPRTASNKVMRRTLRDQFSQG
ncbi:hypothetical protein OAO18_05020, partial [Francisellaceae bacterium]|nr:hypothetical protein [Francisellaceae bacterium]